MFTSYVEEAWQEAVPESTHLVPQTFVDLQWFSVEFNIFLLAVSEHRPALLVFNQAVMVHIRISKRGKNDEEYCNQKRDHTEKTNTCFEISQQVQLFKGVDITSIYGYFFYSLASTVSAAGPLLTC